jgi:hypothetical protein
MTILYALQPRGGREHAEPPILPGIDIKLQWLLQEGSISTSTKVHELLYMSQQK